MTSLADSVLPLIRTRTDLSRWNAANAHGGQMHVAIDILEDAVAPAGAVEPAEAYAVAHKALASSLKVIARADDSSGIIGDACRRLLALHPVLAAAASIPSSTLVTWMISFQFDGDVDYFELDPVDYAPALGEAGMRLYRERLAVIRASLAPQPGPDRWEDPERHARWVLEWNEKRLAVLDRDVEAIIRTHARDRKVAAWLHETAVAFTEIGEFDLAIDWAKQATDFDRGHQALRASDYWCELLEEHRPEELLAARRFVFLRWPTSLTASRLHAAAAATWPDYESEVMGLLAANPDDAVMFTLSSLKDASRAWDLAHSLGLTSERVWSELVEQYERIDPLATLDVHCGLVESALEEADAKRYRDAAGRLARMRALASGSHRADEVDHFIEELRETHRRRPRLQQEFDRAGLPRA